MDITYEEALSIIRSKYNKNLIWCCKEYKDAYIFSISIDDKFVNNDLSLMNAIVNKHTKDVSSAPIGLITLRYGLEEPKITYIDITEDQLKN